MLIMLGGSMPSRQIHRRQIGLSVEVGLQVCRTRETQIECNHAADQDMTDLLFAIAAKLFETGQGQLELQ